MIPPYFHVVFTLPHELNSLIYCNQKLLYGFFHRCCAETLLELSADKKHLGATPGIIQVLHTWDQEINYHVHMHCIVSGAGLTSDHKIRKGKKKTSFSGWKSCEISSRVNFSQACSHSFKTDSCIFQLPVKKLRNSYEWSEFRNSLYQKDWCPYVKETFNGFGNAIEYLGRYTHKVAISNSRILSINEQQVTFFLQEAEHLVNHSGRSLWITRNSSAVI